MLERSAVNVKVWLLKKSKNVTSIQQSNGLLFFTFSALSTISAVALGSFLGGVMSRRIEMTPQTTLKLITIFYLVNFICLCSGFFLGCDQPTLVGDNGKGYCIVLCRIVLYCSIVLYLGNRLWFCVLCCKLSSVLSSDAEQFKHEGRQSMQNHNIFAF